MQRASLLSTTAEIIAIALLTAVGARAAKQWATYAKQASAARSTLVGGLAEPGVELGTLNGISLRGEYVNPAWTDRTWVVSFLLRGRTAARDLKFWNSVAEAFSTTSWIQFRGYCEAKACAVASRSRREVIVFRAGALRTLEAVLQADREGKAVLITAANRREFADVPWRSSLNPMRFRSQVLAAMR